MHFYRLSRNKYRASACLLTLCVAAYMTSWAWGGADAKRSRRSLSDDFVYAGGHGLRAFKVTNSGILKPININLTDIPQYMQFLMISPDNQYLYVGGTQPLEEGQYAQSSLLQYRITSGGTLLFSHTFVTGGYQDAPTSIAFGFGARYVYVVTTSGILFQYRVTGNGRMFPVHIPVQTIGRYSSIYADPNGRFVYILHERDNEISQYQVEPSGTLKILSPATIHTTRHPARMIFHPGGRIVEVANADECSLSQFRITTNGTLRYMKSMLFGHNKRIPTVAISPNGRFMYVAAGRKINDAFQTEQYRIVGNNFKRLLTSIPIDPYKIVIDRRSRYAYCLVNVGSGFDVINQYYIHENGTLSPQKPAIVPAGGELFSLAITAASVHRKSSGTSR